MLRQSSDRCSHSVVVAGIRYSSRCGHPPLLRASARARCGQAARVGSRCGGHPLQVCSLVFDAGIRSHGGHPLSQAGLPLRWHTPLRNSRPQHLSDRTNLPFNSLDMAGRPAKRQRSLLTKDLLANISHRGGVSSLGLRELLREVADMLNIPVHVPYKGQHQAEREMFDKLSISIPLPLLDGGEFKWKLIHPTRLLTEAVRSIRCIADCYSAAFRRQPPTLERPWSLVCAFDEYIPGSKLKIDNTRKAQVFSFTFLELGAPSDETIWLTPVVVRSMKVAEVCGGWSRMFRDILRLLLLGHGGLNTGGVVVELGGQSQLIFARLTNIMSDGDGLRQVFDWKGHASLKPCMKHYNIFKKGSDLASRRPGYVEIDCADMTAFHQWSVPDLCNTMDLLVATSRQVEAGTLPKARLDEISRVCGFNPNADGTLADTELRACFDAAEVCTYDWVHNTFQDGTFTVEASEFLRRAEGFVSRRELETFLRDEAWCFPQADRQKSKMLHRVFSSYRESREGDPYKVRASASENLGLYALLRHFIETRLAAVDGLAAERASFASCCQVIDIFLAAKRNQADPLESAAALRRALVQHMTLHKACYGNSVLRPKHHWNMDIPQQLAKAHCLIDTFVIERKHLLIKSLAEPVKNTVDFEASVLAAILTTSRRSTPTACHHGLKGNVAEASPGVFAGNRILCSGLCVALGDVVFNGDMAGLVQACLSEAGNLFVVVDVLDTIRPISLHSSAYGMRDQTQLWPFDSLLLAVAWYANGDGTWTVIRM